MRPAEGPAARQPAAGASACVAMYYLRKRLRRYHIPLLPALLYRLSIAFYGADIDDNVVLGDGLRLTHGNVVIAAFTTIADRVTIGPYVTIGTRAGSFDGPTIGDDVTIGAHSSILGPWRIGEGATIAPGSVVVGDVTAHTTVAGVPAREEARATEGGLRVIS